MLLVSRLVSKLLVSVWSGDEWDGDSEPLPAPNSERDPPFALAPLAAAAAEWLCSKPPSGLLLPTLPLPWSYGTVPCAACCCETPPVFRKFRGVQSVNDGGVPSPGEDVPPVVGEEQSKLMFRRRSFSVSVVRPFVETRPPEPLPSTKSLSNPNSSYALTIPTDTASSPLPPLDCSRFGKYGCAVGDWPLPPPQLTPLLVLLLLVLLAVLLLWLLPMIPPPSRLPAVSRSGECSDGLGMRRLEKVNGFEETDPLLPEPQPPDPLLAQPPAALFAPELEELRMLPVSQPAAPEPPSDVENGPIEGWCERC